VFFFLFYLTLPFVQVHVFPFVFLSAPPPSAGVRGFQGEQQRLLGQVGFERQEQGKGNRALLLLVFVFV